MVEKFSKQQQNGAMKMNPFSDRRKAKEPDQTIYNQLQFPSTSNFGSMKRKKKSREAETELSESFQFTEQEYTDNNVKIWSLQYNSK